MVPKSALCTPPAAGHTMPGWAGNQHCIQRRPRGLLEPCAATSCTHGSEGAPAQQCAGHLKVRLDQEKLCLLVMIGVRADGRKELVALADGYRESAESW